MNLRRHEPDDMDVDQTGTAAPATNAIQTARAANSGANDAGANKQVS